MTAPLIGSIVHYVSYGTPAGEFTSTCRSAVVTEVGDNSVIGVAVINPTGMFFHPLSAGGCHYDWPGDGISQPRGGTWHYYHLL